MDFSSLTFLAALPEFILIFFALILVLVAAFARQSDGHMKTVRTISLVGYAAGFTPNPTYEEVCSGQTGHNEVVLVVYDPEVVSYQILVKTFFESHNPTQGMQQGNDKGTQYRSGIYFFNDAQQQLAQNPDDLEIKVKLAVQLHQANQVEEALQLILSVLYKDLNYGEAKKLTLDMINALPDGDPLKSKYRRKVYGLLY